MKNVAERALIQSEATNRLAAASKAQANTLDKQLSVMQKGQRPWLGLGSQMTLTHPPRFNEMIGPQPPQKGRVSLRIEGTFVIHNFGTAPAFGEDTDITIDLPTNDTITRPPANLIDCHTANTKMSSGEVIFPGSGVNSGFDIQATKLIPGKPITEMRRVWLVGCISYFDSEERVHSTKFWLRSNFPDNTPWIQLTPDFRYMPILSFESWGEEAN
jgi:hypothetical protein